MGLLWELKELILIRHLGQSLAHSKPYITYILGEESWLEFHIQEWKKNQPKQKCRVREPNPGTKNPRLRGPCSLQCSGPESACASESLKAHWGPIDFPYFKFHTNLKTISIALHSNYKSNVGLPRHGTQNKAKKEMKKHTLYLRDDTAQTFLLVYVLTSTCIVSKKEKF